MFRSCRICHGVGKGQHNRKFAWFGGTCSENIAPGHFSRFETNRAMQETLSIQVFGVAVACSSATSRIARSGQRSGVQFWGYFMVFEDHKGYKAFGIELGCDEDQRWWDFNDFENLAVSSAKCSLSLVQEDIFVEPAVSAAAPQLQRPSNSWFISSIRADDWWPQVNEFHTTGHQNRWFWSLHIFSQ